MDEQISWVYIAAFVWPHEYYMLQAFLESNGVKVFMRDELTISVDPLLSNAMGGIKMYVPEDQYAEASALLKEFHNQASEKPGIDTPENSE